MIKKSKKEKKKMKDENQKIKNQASDVRMRAYVPLQIQQQSVHPVLPATRERKHPQPYLQRQRKEVEKRGK